MLALDIARGAVGLDGKTILPLRFAMSRDPEMLRAPMRRRPGGEKVSGCRAGRRHAQPR